MYTLEEIRHVAEDLRKQGKRIVTINGAFDLLHPGHVRSLREARRQGDVLIVGLNSDKSIQAYKTQHRPILKQELRGEMLSALECVDYTVLIDEPEIAIPLIKAVRPDVHANSSEYGEDCVESKILKRIGARLFLIPKYYNLSTTDLMRKIVEIQKEENEN